MKNDNNSYTSKKKSKKRNSSPSKYIESSFETSKYQGAKNMRIQEWHRALYQRAHWIRKIDTEKIEHFEWLLEKIIDSPLSSTSNYMYFDLNPKIEPVLELNLQAAEALKLKPTKRYANISIDMYSTDKEIMESFKILLKKKRKIAVGNENLKVPKGQISKSDINIWFENGVLQYLDLVIISKLLNVKLTQAVIGRLIFPNESVDSTEKIRKSTIPLVKILLSESYITAFGRITGAVDIS